MQRSLRAEIEFKPLDRRSWRVCDRRAGYRDAAGLIGYVERVREGYDVVWMVGPRTPSRFGSLEAVLDAAVIRLGMRAPTALPAGTLADWAGRTDPVL
jgi:hypothetical protein